MTNEEALCGATHNAGAIRRRVANFAPRQDRELTLHAGRGLAGRGHDVQRADTLAVQAGVLGKTLSPQK